MFLIVSYIISMVRVLETNHFLFRPSILFTNLKVLVNISSGEPLFYT